MLRPALPSDAAAIARVHVASWRSAYRGLLPDTLLAGLSEARREAAFRARLEAPAPRSLLLVSEVNGALDGFALGGQNRDAPHDDVAEVYAIYVDERRWDTGLGRALLEASFEQLRAFGFSRVTLWVLDTNARARRFYERAGFVPDGAAKLETLEGAVLSEVRYGRAL